MANLEHVAKLKGDLVAWNKWRRENPDIVPDVTSADLQNANFSGADLRGANLREANLRWADLRWANLRWADLRWANLSVADLSGADLREAHLSVADLSWADLSGADLTGAYLSGASLLGTNLERATLSECRIYGVSVWDARLDQSVQRNLVITPDDQPTIEVDNLEVAQFIYLLLNNQKIRDVIDTIGKKAVLILGRFASERKAVLDAVRDALRHYGYLPILFDFEKPSSRDLQETIVTLAHLSRFIIADISDPRSIPQELAVIVPNLPSVPVQPLLQSGYEPWAMYDHIRRYEWVLPLHTYSDQQKLLEELEQQVIAPSESKVRAQTAAVKQIDLSTTPGKLP